MVSENEKIIKIPQMESIKRTAEIFGLPVHFVRSKVASGEVVAVRAGRRFLVNIDKFAEFLNTNRLAASDNVDNADKGKIVPIDLRR